ncbi:MAG: hypothetical protein HKN76_20475, partial [Saprospiraceae bacterium]|nr:hypothetical protein [Saprospiraceae bacterium]
TSILLSLLFFLSYSQAPEDTVEIRGIYGHPKPFWDKGLNLKDLGVNAVFVHSGSINQEMMNQARSEGQKVFAEFATLNGKNYVDRHPEAWAIDDKGNRVEAASWFMGVCPTEPGFRKYRFDQLRDLLTKFDLDGVWMDYVHWHAQFEEPEPILPETCFCDHCLVEFSKDSGLEIPQGHTAIKAKWILDHHEEAWRDWRCEVIYDWTVEIKRIIKQERPEALLGLYHCPWNDDEFNGARRRILGLDYNLLNESIDVFSPMVYHRRMGRNADWVKANIEWFSKRLQVSKDGYPKIWPIVQAHNDPGIIGAEEFETVLLGALAGESSGVMMFTSHAVAEDSGKTAVMKKVYRQLIDAKSN